MRHLILALCFIAAPAFGRENPYDLLGKVLMPCGQMLAESSKTPNRAVTMSVRVDGATSSGERAASLPLRIALEMPDRLRITAPFEGETITVCRRGQKIWAFPGSRAKALLSDSAVTRRLPAPNPKFKLSPFSLPVPEKQLAFLPVLFRVQDAGNAPIAGIDCQVLDLRLMPELAKSVSAQANFSARAWVAPDYRLARLQVDTAEGHATLHFDELRYTPSLPVSTWQPTSEEEADLLPLTPAVYDQLIRAFLVPH